VSSIQASELIVNPDGSIYHLNLKPGQIGETIILVGDQNRVEKVSKHFDQIHLKVASREFCTHTGSLNGKSISVISTGIGTDNIDIVINELDALVNIDFDTREVTPELTSLNFIRIGTSGALQPDVDIDSYLVSSHGLGLGGLINYYENSASQDQGLLQKIKTHLKDELPVAPYLIPASSQLIETVGKGFQRGITATCPGFYGPQGRSLRLPLYKADYLKDLRSFKAGEYRITNFEMETAGIYGLATLLGHQAISFNAILANRALGTFSEQAGKTIERLIEQVLRRI